MFDWKDFLDLAERLSNETDEEAALRSAISRAYYAAYHAAATFVRRSGLLPTGHSHARVWETLASLPNADVRDIGERGVALKRLRTNADYRATFPGDLKLLAVYSVTEARLLVDSFGRLTEI